MSLPAFSVRQSVLVNVLFFVSLFGGLAAYSRIPVEYWQEVVLNSVNLTTVWSGASADEVERLLTQKLEEELLSVADVKEMRSTSTANLSAIVIDFDEDLDALEYEAAVNDVRAALDRATDLPESAEETTLFEVTVSEVTPVVLVAVVDTIGVGEVALAEMADEVEACLDDIYGVRRASILGEREREVRVLIDRDLSARYGLTVLEVVDRIRRQNLNLPAGTFETEDVEATLRARGDYQDTHELLETVVRENEDGTYVRLSDIARLEVGLEKRLIATRYNGHPAILVNVTKSSGEDVVELVERVEAWMAEYRPFLPEGVELHKTLDAASFVSPRIQTLADNLVSGIVLVMAILWVAIGFRNAALTVIAIPFSFLTAMILFPVLEITINSTTLMGMLLVSGMLVDDAIIVLENIYARIEEGEELRDAVIGGAEEVLLPVVAAVATTAAAFAPLLLVGGTPGKFVAIMPKAVLLCLSASLFECLIILPAHYMDFGSRVAAREPVGASAPWRRWLSWPAQIVPLLRGLYARALDVVLAHRMSFGLMTLAVLMLSLGAWGHLRVELFPGEFDNFNVMLETPPGYSLSQTERVAYGIEQELLPFVGDGVTDFATTVGSSVASNYDRITATNVARTFLVLEPTDENRKSPERLLFRVRDRVEDFRRRHASSISELRVAAEQDGPPIGPPVEVRIHADDYALVRSIASEMTAFLETLPGVYNVEHNLERGAEEVRLVIDEERAARHGVRFEDLALALRGANDGIVASSFRDPRRDDDMDIRVMLEEGDRRDLADLLDVEIRAPGVISCACATSATSTSSAATCRTGTTTASAPSTSTPRWTTNWRHRRRPTKHCARTSPTSTSAIRRRASRMAANSRSLRKRSTASSPCCPSPSCGST